MSNHSNPQPRLNRQRTLKEPVIIEGYGLHTGEYCRVKLEPADPSSGIIFALPDGTEVKASIENAVSEGFFTGLKYNGEIVVYTIEHLMCALYIAGIDNCRVRIESGREIPELDGSPAGFLDYLLRAGTQEQQEGFRNVATLSYSRVWKNGDSAYYYIPADEQLLIKGIIDLPGWGAVADALEVYDFKGSGNTPSSDAYRARTFLPLSKVKFLKESGLIKGGSLEYAILVRDIEITEKLESEIRNLFPNEGDYELTPVFVYRGRIPQLNEPARHKLLDFLGDLYLTGLRWQGVFIIEKPGHENNLKFARWILNEYKTEHEVPQYNPDREPVMGVTDIEKVLPHRHSFMLIDRIIHIDDKTVVGIKAVTYNEPFFRGHFPGNPVMPGVLIIEAMAQTGGVLALKAVSDPWNWDTYFLKIDNVRFKKKVLPGDVLVMRLELLKPIRRGIIHMYGRAYVGKSLVAEAEMVALIVRKRDAAGS